MLVEIMNVAEINADTKEQGLAFKKLTREEGAVYSVLCPSKNRVTADKILANPNIPERIKEIVEMTKERFRNFEIWDAESYKVKDPILIGRQAQSGDNGKYDFYDEQFLVARWGEELEAFPILFEKAKTLIKKQSKVALLRAKAEIDSRLMDMDAFIEDAFLRGEHSLPQIDLGVLK